MTAAMESAIRKWHNLIASTTVGSAHSPVGESGPTMADYMEMFASATLHQQAYQAVVNALITDNVRWTDDPDRPVDQELYTFIETAVAHLMVTGFLVWRSHPDIGVEAASPADMSIAMGPDGVWAPAPRNTIGVGVNADGWQLGVMDQPVVDAAVYHEAVVDDRRIRSAVARAYAETIRVDHIQDHWLRRDMHNSRPAVWTTVAGSIGNANGSTRPWFRGLGWAGTADRQVDPEVGNAHASGAAEPHTRSRTCGAAPAEPHPRSGCGVGAQWMRSRTCGAAPAQRVRSGCAVDAGVGAEPHPRSECAWIPNGAPRRSAALRGAPRRRWTLTR